MPRVWVRVGLYLLFFASIFVAEAPGARAEGGPRVSGMPCGERKDLIGRLGAQYDEHPAGLGMTETGAVVELLTGKQETWTLLVSFPDGRSCLLATGEGWQNRPEPGEGEPL